MKKQETPAQPKVVPAAVADFFSRPIGTVKIIVAQPPPNYPGFTLD